MTNRPLFLQGLNEPQYEAATTIDGPLLVLAGAGTGKTRVITCRLAEIIRRGHQASRILSVTFTNKAAKEMRERAMAIIGRVKEKPVVSTFHAYCVQVLRQEIDRLGYPKSFMIYDRGDQEAAARSALREMKMTEKAMKPADLLSRISRWKMAGVSPDQVSEAGDFEDDFDHVAGLTYRRYQRILKAAGAVDFDDLLRLTVELFESDPEARQRQQSKFDFVQIDEYQDTNSIQFRLIRQLVAPHQNLCVVGDDDQSIYAWRGAEVTHILNFGQHFPSAKIVRLEENYRCRHQILTLANSLVRHNRGRHPKVLHAGKSGNAEIRFREYPDETEEARQIAFELDYYINQLNVSPGEIAVLYRTNDQPRIFESEFRRKKLPYRIIGSQSFFDRKEIRDLVAYLRAIAFPRDLHALLRIVNVPARGIGRSTVEKVVTAASKSSHDFWSTVKQLQSQGEITSRISTSLDRLHGMLGRYRGEFSSSPKKLHSVMSRLIEEINYKAEIEKNYSEPTQQLARSVAIDQLLDALSEYAAQESKPSLHGFLQQTSLEGRDITSDNDEREQTDAIRLMTLHSAKGLEFPRVYLVGMEEGILPHQKSVESGGAAIEEERRLAYVGLTRAMDHLTISRAAARRKWNKLRPTIPSRFLAEMSKKQEEAINAEIEEAAAGATQ
ncbi:ATP-dependent helicase [Calycomorphotria hydatis]|uniref:DNA 3'-5' helicase n=1 Tax=Calycomorphotria hydatis TaxID=2528027 RepID=A0A517T7A3_9PLAN|nr:UvrD-helicase domain-containing protein [Calycomorphotria hydatis]QDT64247.1 ATP-dependent DNA helicase PcrA [Calycomorphotria hydatis]